MPQCSRWQSFERGFRLIGVRHGRPKKIKDGTTHRFESYFERDQYDTMDGNNDYDEDAGWKLDGMRRGPAIEYCYGLSRLAIAAENVTALDEFLSWFDKTLRCGRGFAATLVILPV